MEMSSIQGCSYGDIQTYIGSTKLRYSVPFSYHHSSSIEIVTALGAYEGTDCIALRVVGAECSVSHCACHTGVYISTIWNNHVVTSRDVI